ncbi:MAG: DUF1667 domain-containing protein [Candidatus Marinimicrobia bacterium]|nr:DUF1667 domain-containing protein [Candidatus Neomarinimicrobiota bacterium]
MPKGKIFEAMEHINACTAHPPVRCGQAIIRNIAETSVDICASRDMKK